MSGSAGSAESHAGAPGTGADRGAPGTGASSAGDPTSRTAKMRRPWVRLGLLSAATAGLVLSATAWDGTLLGAPGASAGGTDTAQTTGPADGAGPTGRTVGTGAGDAGVAPGEPVRSAALACPGLGLLGAGDGEPGVQRAEVAAAVAPPRLADAPAPAPTGAGDGGGAELGPGGQDGGGDGDRQTVPADGVATLSLQTAAPAFVDAAGAAARGVVGGQLGLSTASGTRGLSLAPCTPASDTRWLVGGGAGSGRTEQLVLTNPGEDAVTVEVDVWGADGPAATNGATGLVVPARGRAVHLLDALAPDVTSPVLRVRAAGGPVAAHLGEHHRDGTTDLGSELVGPAAAPATDLVVPAVGPAADGQEVVLRVATPGDRPALVDVTALTADGAVGLPSAVTRVKAGHTADVPLRDLPDGLVALRLRSDTPVTAGARLELAPATTDPLATGDAAARTGAADEEATTSGPDDAARTGAPAPTRRPQPLLRPAGELAWVAATTPSRAPVGTALPATDGIPGRTATLAVTVVDATEVEVHLRLADGSVRTEALGRLPNDTTRELALPEDVRGIWVSAAGAAGVVASVVLGGEDEVGPYAAASTLPAVPWERARSQVVLVAP